MPKIIIDAQELEVPAGTNLVDAAARIGVQIPHYCYHPGLKVEGNCRMCMVEVPNPRGGEGFVPSTACTTPLKDGLVVKTNTPLVKQLQRNVMEFLLLNHPIDCPICDQAGECRLQDYYMEYALYDNRLKDLTKVHKAKVVDVGPLVVLDQERCVLCSRCVRFTRDITRTHEFVIAGRGDHARIEIFPDTRLDNPYSGNVVDICPVGALTSKDFRFKKRVWMLKSAKSVCVGCARGCNVWLDHADGVTWRYRPRENLQVNDYWLCDAGRLSYKRLNEGRLTQALVGGQPSTPAAAVAAAQAAIQAALDAGGPHAVAAFASPHATVEDNLVLKRLMEGVLGGRIWGAEWTPPGDADDFLVVSDKAPNRQGLHRLGVDQGKEAPLAALQGGQVKVLLMMANDLAGLGGTEVAAALDAVETLIVLSPHHTPTVARATIALPACLHGETRGTFVNVQDRIQRVAPGPVPPGDALPAWEILGMIGAKFAPQFPYADLDAIWADLRATYPELGDVSFYAIGDEGRPWAPEVVSCVQV